MRASASLLPSWMPGLRQVGEATSLLCFPGAICPSSSVEVLLNQLYMPKSPQASLSPSSDTTDAFGHLPSCIRSVLRRLEIFVSHILLPNINKYHLCGGWAVEVCMSCCRLMCTLLLGADLVGADFIFLEFFSFSWMPLCFATQCKYWDSFWEGEMA